MIYYAHFYEIVDAKIDEFSQQQQQQHNNNLTVFGRWILGGGEYTKLTPVIFEKGKMSGIYVVPKSLKSGRLRLCH